MSTKRYLALVLLCVFSLCGCPTPGADDAVSGPPAAKDQTVAKIPNIFSMLFLRLAALFAVSLWLTERASLHNPAKGYALSRCKQREAEPRKIKEPPRMPF